MEHAPLPAEIEDFARDEMTRTGVPGLAVGVIADGAANGTGGGGGRA